MSRVFLLMSAVVGASGLGGGEAAAQCGCRGGCGMSSMGGMPMNGKSMGGMPMGDKAMNGMVMAANGADEAKIKANLAKLSPDDRKLAEDQKYCPVEDDNRLGSMGVPIKVMINNQAVFLCCKGCKDDAQKDTDKTLAKVKELKAKAAREK